MSSEKNPIENKEGAVSRLFISSSVVGLNDSKV
jgi:hypothetical protein